VVVDWWWQGRGIGGRDAVEWRWIRGGQGRGCFAAVALRQQLCGSALAAASLAEAAAALLQRSSGGGSSGSGQLGGGMIINKTRNNLWI
jgi:hypothetical protein